MRLYILRSPNTFRKYHDAELTLDVYTTDSSIAIEHTLKY